MTEEWRPVVGWKGFYEVSDAGRVRSVDRIVASGRGWTTPRKGRILRLSLTSGYRRCVLSDSPHRKKKYALVHQLVAEAFIGCRPDGMTVCHNNGDRTDNRASNLRWDSPSENNFDRVRHGTHHQARKLCCPAGHQYDGLYTDKNGSKHRYCISCSRERRARGRRAA